LYCPSDSSPPKSPPCVFKWLNAQYCQPRQGLPSQLCVQGVGYWDGVLLRLLSQFFNRWWLSFLQ
jgi:hypothetical protein